MHSHILRAHRVGAYHLDTQSELTVFFLFVVVSSIIHSSLFTPDGMCVASCGSDRTINLWDLRTHKLLQHYDAHADTIHDLSFHPSGNFMLSASSDATIKVWDLREGVLYYTIQAHEGPVTACSFSPAGDFFGTGGADTQVLVWKTNFDALIEDSNTSFLFYFLVVILRLL